MQFASLNQFIMKHLIALALCALLTTVLTAQHGIDITVRLNGLNYDTLWFGHTFGKRAIPDFATTRQADGSFVFQIASPVPEGQYAIVFKRAANAKYTFVTILVPDDERQFSLTMDISDPYKTAVFEGSPENTYYGKYLNQIYSLLDQRDSLVTEWRMLPDEGNFIQLTTAENKINRLQEQVIASNPSSLTASLVRTVYFANPPATAGSDWRERASQRQEWIRNHYFEGVDPIDPNRWRIPLSVEWLDFFVFKASPPDPDSAIWYVDDALQRLSANDAMKEYYFNYMVNSFSRMSRFNMDEVFIHLFRNYIEKGKAPWTKEEEKNNMLRDIQRIEKVLVGKTAPDITLYDRSQAPVRIHDIDAPYLLLVFWNPDCSHCQKELPVLARIYERFRDQGLKVVATCGKKTAELPNCWKFIDDQHLPEDWIYLGDGDFKSRFNSLYDLRSFPKLYLLDQDRTILFRRGGESSESELMTFFEKLIR